MTDYFVDSGAGGLNDGTSKTDAWTSAASITGLAAGDHVRVSKTHNESTASNITIDLTSGTYAAPIVVYAVDFSDDSLWEPDWSTDTLPRVQTTGNSDVIITGQAYLQGIRFTVGDDFFPSASNARQEYLNCWFEVLGAGDRPFAYAANTSNPRDVVLTKCKFTIAAASTAPVVAASAAGPLFIEDMLTENSSNYLFSMAATRPSFVEVNGGDVSSHSGDLVRFTAQGGRLTVRGLLMHASANWVDALPVGPASELLAFGCQSGTLSDPVIGCCRVDHVGCMGAVSNLSTFALDFAAMTGSYRTGGAKDRDRTNPICWPVHCLAGKSAKGIVGTKTLPIGPYWVDGDGSTAFTVKIHFAHSGWGAGTSGALEDDQIWMKIFHGNDAAQDARMILTSTQLAILDTAGDVGSASGETWTGASVGTKQALSVTVTPDGPGLIYAEVFLASGDAVANRTVYLDPKLEVT